MSASMDPARWKGEGDDEERIMCAPEGERSGDDNADDEPNDE